MWRRSRMQTPALHHRASGFHLAVELAAHRQRSAHRRDTVVGIFGRIGPDFGRPALAVHIVLQGEPVEPAVIDIRGDETGIRTVPAASGSAEAENIHNTLLGHTWVRLPERGAAFQDLTKPSGFRSLSKAERTEFRSPDTDGCPVSRRVKSAWRNDRLSITRTRLLYVK